MTYVNWRFGTRLSYYQQTFTVHNDPGPNSHLYLQMYDGSIDGQGYYVGVQTTNLAIFSKFGTTNLADVRTGTSAIKVSGTDEGPYVSLRQSYTLSAGTYTIRIIRNEFDGNGDWFDYYLARAGEAGNGTYIGGIRFQRSTAGTPATLPDFGGTWTEFWDNNGATLYPVPYWKLSFGIPVTTGGKAATSATTAYSAMPNSDIYYDTADGLVKAELGASTPRCHTAGSFALVITPPATVITPVTPTRPTNSGSTDTPEPVVPPEISFTPPTAPDTAKLVELTPTTLIKLAVGDPTALSSQDTDQPAVTEITGSRYWLPPLDNLQQIASVTYTLDDQETYTSSDGLFGYELDTTWLKNGEHRLEITVLYKDDTAPKTITSTFTTTNHPNFGARLQRRITAPYHWLFNVFD
jgi:hypothetical protein